jgi:putative oxidoreductase
MADVLITGNRREASAGQDSGKLLLRLVLGVLILLHGVSKIAGGIDPIVAAVGKAGLPQAFAYLVYVGEVVAPILLIVGLWTRAVALVIVIDMIVAVLLVHAGQALQLDPQTGGYALELQALYLFGALAIALLGAGRYSFGGRYGRWN